MHVGRITRLVSLGMNGAQDRARARSKGTARGCHHLPTAAATRPDHGRVGRHCTPSLVTEETPPRLQHRPRRRPRRPPPSPASSSLRRAPVGEAGAEGAVQAWTVSPWHAGRPTARPRGDPQPAATAGAAGAAAPRRTRQVLQQVQELLDGRHHRLQLGLQAGPPCTARGRRGGGPRASRRPRRSSGPLLRARRCGHLPAPQCDAPLPRALAHLPRRAPRGPAPAAPHRTWRAPAAAPWPARAADACVAGV